MKLSLRAAVLVGAAALVAVPSSAVVYTISLNNGTTFETRYEPRDAYWDSSMIVFEDEVGNVIALAKSDVADVVTDVTAKGYGKMLDDTTMAFGWAPNDLDEKTASAEPASSEEAEEETEPVYEPGESPGMPLYITIPNAEGGDSGDAGAAAPAAPPEPPASPEPEPDLTDTSSSDTGDAGEPPPVF